MPREPIYRMVAVELLTGKLWVVSGSHHFRCGVGIALVFVGSKLSGQEAKTTVSLLPPPVHSISPAIRDAVTAKPPKYQPAPPPVIAAEPAQEEATYDASRDILHLPKLTVKERPYTPPNGFDLLTPKGRLDLALKTHPGLRIGNILGMNHGIALAMQAEERAAEQKAAIADTIRSSTSDNTPEYKKLMGLLKAASQRSNSEWASYDGPLSH